MEWNESSLSPNLNCLVLFKDAMMESFFKTGDFFTESGVARVEPFVLPRRYYSLMNTIGWSIVSHVPVFYYLRRLLMSGSSLYISIGISIILSRKY